MTIDGDDTMMTLENMGMAESGMKPIEERRGIYARMSEGGGGRGLRF